MDNCKYIPTTEPTNNDSARPVKALLEELKAINYETEAQLRLIMDALIDGETPVECVGEGGIREEKALSLIQTLKQEVDHASENLDRICRIRDHLW